jgi:uncharacterized membrane protein YczE
MLIRRLILLFPGLALYGLSTALMVRADLGLNPWNVLHQGLARATGLSIGMVIVVVGVVLLLAWIPLRQWPGFGTVSNVMLIGVTADASLAVLPSPHTLALRLVALAAAVALNGLATGMYIGAGLGAGPRDGLMTGLAARTGCSIRVARTGVEVSALALGWLLGGTVGLGTVLYAAAIGPVIQVVLPAFQRWRERGAAPVAGELRA